MAHSPQNQYSFVPDPHTADYLAMDHRQHDRSPSPARKFWPFNRSRSSSPNTQGQQPNLNLDTSFNTTRSRKSSNNDAVSPSGSASSFVVRSVVRNPGGVSLPTSPVGEQNQPFFSQASRQQSASPGGARRMTLEDSDDDMSQPQQLQYRRSKSKPLGAAPASLSVPAGGPGGGVGYGTARSSNDGRPESANAHQPSPYYRPASPSASMKAGEFQKGAKDRGRSPRKSISGTSSSHSHSGHSGVPTLEQQSRSGSAHSAQSSAANSSGGKKPVARITAGPKSLAQQQQEQQQPSSRGPSPAGARHAALSGPRQFPGGQPPVGFQQQQHYHPQAPRNHSAGPPPLDQRGMMNFPPTMPAAQDEQSRDDPPSRSRRFSFGIVNRLRRDSDAGNQSPMMPAAAPLDGLPSPVDIPFGRSPNSPLRYDNGAETDYSRANSPFGSVSPAKAGGSPNSSGFLSTLMGRQAAEEREARRNQHPDDGVPRSCSPSGIGGSNLAGKWFKGVFGRSPYADEKDPNYAGELNPFPFTSSGGGARDAEDEAAYAQKLASMRQARHIVDEERQRHFMGPTTPTRPGARGGAPMFDPAQDREFRPKQVIDTDEDEGLDAALEFELGRKKSPPGRKPVPAYLPAAVKQGDESDLRDAVRATEEPLTLAQKIIQETRSKQLAREHIEAQRKQAITQQKEIANAPPTPPKTNFSSAAAGGHGQRFPSGAHQITREPAKIGAPISAPGSARNQGGSTLAPGSGPMPMDMPLPSALQEMMIRFYRFERYSVPLIRSLETRLLDIERDSMLANNPQARSASVSSHNSAEMDRWVTQMTSLMKHEVGQLRAATLEIKESRELVANIAKHGAGMGLNNSVSSFGSLVAITPSASVQQAEKARETNVSSSTFQSAVPRAAGIKQASPTKANFGFASESSKEQKASVRDRSVSPNPRPRFTDVLGKPMVGGRLSPSPAVASPVEGSKVEDRLKALLPTKQEDSRVETEDEVEEEEKGDESVSDDIAAALAAIDATSSAPTPAAVEEKEEHHIPIAKSASNSSADSAEAAEEPLTPTLELPSHPAKEVSEVSTKSSALPYLSDSKPTSPVKTHFPSASAGSASGRISPTKLFAHKFAATPSSSSATSTGSLKASVKLGLVEKKRFTLPPPTTTTTAATGGMMGVTTVVAARQGGKLSRTPSYSLEEKDGVAGPTSAAFSGLAKVKPVGHTATLRERVAFFDTAK